MINTFNKNKKSNSLTLCQKVHQKGCCLVWYYPQFIKDHGPI